MVIEEDEEEEVVDGGGSINGGVEKMVIQDDDTTGEKKKGVGRRKVTIRYHDMGGVIGGGHFSKEEEEDCMLVPLTDGRRVMKHLLFKSNGSGETNDDNTTTTAEAAAPTNNDTIPTTTKSSEQLEEDLSRPFALPHPARQALLSVVLLLLSKKGMWRSVSNAALFPKEDDNDDPNNNNNGNRWMLLLNWRALLSMLLRTAPYLDEHKAGVPPMEASSMRSKILKSTVSMIRSCRCFFDQGIRPPGWKGGSGSGDPVELDATARALWKMTETDLLYHTHSNSCFRAQIMLYLFHPSKCSSAYYLEVMPKWMESWRNVDRCPEYDYLWMVMFGRARKYIHPRDHDWGALRRHLLTQCGYW